MTKEPRSEDETSYPPFDEVQSKRIGREVRQSIEFREEIFARDPDSAVQPETAAAVLGWQVDDLTAALDDGRLGFVEVDGKRVIRVADVRVAFDEETARLDRFSKGWTELRSKLDWDD